MRYVEEREQFGKPLATFQALQFKLADMLTELTASRQMVRLGAHRLDRATPRRPCTAQWPSASPPTAASMSQRGLATARRLRLSQRLSAGRWVRDTRVHQILEGTNEIMRVIVARRLLEQGGMLDRLL